jgi:acyl-CoA thioesterase FadM
VVRASLRFVRPARFEDVLDVHAGCTRVGRSSFDLSIIVLRDDEEIAVVDLMYVNVDTVTERSAPLTPGVAQRLRAEAAASTAGEHPHPAGKALPRTDLAGAVVSDEHRRL